MRFFLPLYSTMGTSGVGVATAGSSAGGGADTFIDVIEISSGVGGRDAVYAVPMSAATAAATADGATLAWAAFFAASAASAAAQKVAGSADAAAAAAIVAAATDVLVGAAVAWFGSIGTNGIGTSEVVGSAVPASARSMLAASVSISASKGASRGSPGLIAERERPAGLAAVEVVLERFTGAG